MLGYSREELLARTMADVTHAQDRESGLAALQAVLRGELDSYSAEKRYLRSDGSILWSRVAAEPVRDNGGQPQYIVAVVQDISVEKGSARLFESFFEMSLDPLCIAGLDDGYFKRVNRAFEAALHYSSQELVARPFLEFVHPEDHAATLAEMGRLSAGQRVLSFENRYRDHQGNYRTLAWNAYPIEDERLIYAVARDVTEQRERERLLRQSEESYRRIVELAQEGIWTVGPDGRVTFVNRRFAEMLGSTVPEILGSHFLDFVEPDQREAALLRFEQRRQGEPGKLDFRFLRPDGTYLWGIASSCPLFDEEGTFQGVLAMVADINQRPQGRRRPAGGLRAPVPSAL